MTWGCVERSILQKIERERERVIDRAQKKRARFALCLRIHTLLVLPQWPTIMCFMCVDISALYCFFPFFTFNDWTRLSSKCIHAPTRHWLCIRYHKTAVCGTICVIIHNSTTVWSIYNLCRLFSRAWEIRVLRTSARVHFNSEICHRLFVLTQATCQPNIDPFVVDWHTIYSLGKTCSRDNKTMLVVANSTELDSNPDSSGR